MPQDRSTERLPDDDPSAPVPVLEIRGLTKNFGPVRALDDVSLTVGRGEVVALLGDNGAGKSTLVKMLSGILRPDSGRILIDGVETTIPNPAAAKATGLETVYQDLSLCMNMDVVANFFMGREKVRRRFGIPVTLDEEMETETEQALADIGVRIPDVRSRVENLSGGQRQGIELGRFVHWGGRLVLLDEPFAALGVEQTRKGLDLIERVKAQGIAIIVITHNMFHAFQVADRIVVLRHGKVIGLRRRDETSPEEIIRMITGEELVGPTDAPAAEASRETTTG